MYLTSVKYYVSLSNIHMSTMGLSLKDMRLSKIDSDHNKSILVAIKKLKPDAENSLMEAFNKEVKFMSKLNHDNVVRLLGCG